MASWNKRSRGTKQSARVRSTSRTIRTRQRFVSLELLEQRTLLSISNLVLASPLAPVEGQPFGAFPKLLATFTDANVNVSPQSFQATLQWGDGGIDTDIGRGGSVLILPDSSVESPSVPNQYDVFDTTAHTYLEEGTYLAQLSVTDLTDSGSGTAYSAVTVTDAPLFPVAVSPINATAGLSFTGTVGAFYDSDPNGTVTDYVATIAWGDGVTSAGTIASTGLNGSGLPTFSVGGSHTYAAAGTYATTISIRDLGGSTLTVTGTANVAAAQLSAQPPSPLFTGTEGSSASGVVATFTDPNLTNPISDYSGTIQWGDGSSMAFTSSSIVPTSTPGTYEVFSTHTYAEDTTAPGSLPYNLIFTVNETSNNTLVSTATTSYGVVVKDAMLIGLPTPITTATEGVAGSFVVADFYDLNPKAPTSDFSATINWGDGTTSTFTSADVSLLSQSPALAEFSITAPHTFVQDGILTTKVQINDVGDSTATTTSTATVQDAPITGSPVTVTPNPYEGIGFTSPVATFTTVKPGAVPANYSATINWGDGSSPTTGVITVSGGVFTVTGTHTYAEESPPVYNTTVTITDTASSPGVTPSTATVVTPITVNDAPLTPGTPVAQPIIAVAGIPLLTNPPTSPPTPTGVVVAEFNDTNSNAPISDLPAANQTINWGDGSTSAATGVTQPGGVGTPFYVYATHTYNPTVPLPVTYTATVSINDIGGSKLTINDVVQVVVAPLIVTPVNFQATEGQAFSNQLVATFVNSNPIPPAGTTYAGTIKWGDGATSTVTIAAAAPGQFNVYGSHTYAEDNIYSATISLTSSGGAAGTTGDNVVVNDAPLIGSAVTFKPVVGNVFTGTVAQFTDTDTDTGGGGDYGSVSAGFYGSQSPAITSPTINWGDSTTSVGTIVATGYNSSGQPTFNVVGTHTYTQIATYSPVTVTITDTDANAPSPPPVSIVRQSTTVLSTANVVDAPIYPGNPLTITTTEGSQFPTTFPSNPGLTEVATFTDGNPLATPSQFNGTIIWSLPMTSPIISSLGTIIADPGVKGQFDVLGNHLFTDAAVYPYEVLLGSLGGSTATATGSAVVNDAPLTDIPIGPLQSVAGATFNGVVAQFYDGNHYGTPSDFSATINWSDGNTSPPPAATIVATGTYVNNGPVFDVIDTHAYVYGGQYSIQTTITDTDVQAPIVPSTTTANTTINVADAPILASPVTQPVPTGIEGSSTGTLTVATFSSSNLNLTAANFSATIAWGDGQTSTGTVLPDGTQFEVQGSHTYTEDNIWTGSVTITDNSGTPPATPTSATVPLTTTIYDAPLTAGPSVPVANQVAGQPFSGEVATFTDGDPLASDTSAYTVSIFWGDGTQPTAGTVVQTGPATFKVLGTHTYTEEAPTGAPNSEPCSVTVQITDTDTDRNPPPPASIPRATTSAITSITVHAAPLSLQSATVPQLSEGQSASITLATLTDANPYDTPAAYTATVHWGDGSSSALIPADFVAVANAPGVFKVLASHTYLEEGAYTVTTQVWNTAGGLRPTDSPLNSFASATTTISVADAPITSVGTPQTFTTTFDGSLIYEGNPTGNIAVATFQDANTFAESSDYSATVAWGDGTTSAGTVQPGFYPGMFNVYANHTYAEQGTYNGITVTIHDDGGASAIATNTSIVVSDAPLYPATGPVTIQTFAGTPLGNQLVASFADANPMATPGDFSATIFWGDGSSSSASSIVIEGSSSSSATFGVLGDHSYAAQGAYRIIVQVDDTDGTTTVGSSTVVSQTTVLVNLDPPGNPGSLEGPLVVSGVNPEVTEGTAFTGTVGTFVYALAAVPSQFTASIAWGDGQSSAGIITYDPTLAAFTVAGSHTYTQAGAYSATVMVQDQAGNSSQATSVFSVADAPLSASGQALTATEGSPFSRLVASFTDPDPAATPASYSSTISWGDGQSSAGTIVYSTALAAFTINGSHTYAQAGAYTASVTIRDYGGSTTQVSDAVTIADAPLTSVGQALTATEGSPFSRLVASFTDPDPDATPASYSSTITWGDGQSSAGTIAYSAALAAFTVTGSHTYAQAGAYTASVTIRDYGGSTTQVSDAVTIADAPLTSVGQALTATEGAPFSRLVASFTDPDPDATPASYSASISWGDGQSSAGTIVYSTALAAFTVTGSHTYAQAGAYTASVTIRDYGGSTTQVSDAVTIGDAPLSATGRTLTATAGLPFSGLVATFTDPDPNATPASYSASISWGDGQSSAGTIAYSTALAAFTITGSHSYAQAGAYSASVTIRDYGGATTQVSDAVTIADAPLSATGRTLTATAGTAFSGVVATFTDLDPAATVSSFSATIAWGDGHSSTATIGYDGLHKVFTVSGTNTYTQSGSYSLAVLIHHVGGVSAQATSTAAVASGAPIATGVDLVAVQGVPFSGVLATLTGVDRTTNPSNLIAKIRWGGQNITLGKIIRPAGPAGTTFLVTGTHTFYKAGRATIQVWITGRNGGGRVSMSVNDQMKVLLRAPRLTKRLIPSRPKS